MLDFTLILSGIALPLCSESFMLLLEILEILQIRGSVLRRLVLHLVPEFSKNTVWLHVHSILIVIYSVQACNHTTGIVKLALLLLVVGNLIHIVFTTLRHIIPLLEPLQVDND